MSLFETLSQHWNPDHIALQMGDDVLAYGELTDRVAQGRAWLAQQGVRPGAVVAVRLPKTPVFLVLMLSVVSAGAVFLPINPRSTQAETNAILADAEPFLVIRNAPVFSGLQNMPSVICDGEAEAVRLTTSGTTGRPKGVPLSHRNILAMVQGLHTAWGWSTDDVLLHALPVHHVHGLFVAQLGALLAGATAIWHDGFKADAILRDLPRCTVFMGVPTFYHRLLEHPDIGKTDLSAMRLFTSGSAPLQASDHEAFSSATGHEILERYGMTEVGIVLSNPLKGPRVPGRVGYPLPGMRARIVVPGLEEHVDDDVVGMLHIKGPSVFAGYHNRPKATSKALLAHGWMRTGDLARRDDTGSIQIVGRQDHLILTGGFNVYPIEVETVLSEQPGVGEVCVYAQPDADLGQVVCAAYSGDANESDLRTAVRQALSGYKVPRHYVRLPALPRNPTGKVMRSALPTLPQNR